jgi:hypothetical protein
MIKLNASFSKKVPAEQDYSSKSFMACVEVELPTGATPQELQQKIHETFDLVKRSVEDELADQTTQGQGRKQEGSQGRSQPYIPASNKQIQYILDLGKAREKPLSVLNVEARQRFGVESIYQLNWKDCSRYIEALKAA